MRNNSRQKEKISRQSKYVIASHSNYNYTYEAQTKKS